MHASESSICCRETRQKGCRSPAPADSIIAAHCGPTEIRRFRLRDSLHQAYITLRDKGRAKTRIRYANQSYQHRRGRLNSSVPGWQLFALHMPGVHGCRADNVHGDCRATSARLMSTRRTKAGPYPFEGIPPTGGSRCQRDHQGSRAPAAPARWGRLIQIVATLYRNTGFA